MSALTLKQRELVDYIRAYCAANAGLAPSLREMAAHLGIGSTGNVARLLSCLEELGAIRRIAYRARAIEVIEDDPFAGISNEALVAELERRGYFARTGTH